MEAASALAADDMIRESLKSGFSRIG